jgi:uncharacterized membrane protein
MNAGGEAGEGGSGSPCVPSPCESPRVCEESSGTFRCVCSRGFTGDECDERILERLGYPEGDGASQALAVSADGRVVVGESNPGSPPARCWRWTAMDGFTILEVPVDDACRFAHDVSADGSVVVGESEQRALRWVMSTTAQPLGSAQAITSARGVSADGLVVVGSYGSGQAFRWTQAGGLALLAFVRDGWAEDVNADGTVIVGCSMDQPVRTPVGGISTLDLPNPWTGGCAYGVSDDGTTAVGAGWNETSSGAVRWEVGLYPEELFAPGMAVATSADGSVVVGWSDGMGAIIWDEEHGPRLLSDVLEEKGADLFGWQLLEARDVSADGKVVVGTGLFGGHIQAWLARL